MLALIPAWLGISFFSKNFEVTPQAFLAWYMGGIIISTTILYGRGVLVPTWGKGGILFLGLTLGALANIALFLAIVKAPNPGLPIAIANAASVGVFLLSSLLARWAPRFFDPVKTDSQSLLGVILTIIGVAIIAIRR